MLLTLPLPLLSHSLGCNFFNDDCEANDEFVEASDDEDDISSVADTLGNYKLLPFSLLPVNFFTLVCREGVYSGLRCEGVPANVP